jgi:hypothetical protein
MTMCAYEYVRVPVCVESVHQAALRVRADRLGNTHSCSKTSLSVLQSQSVSDGTHTEESLEEEQESLERWHSGKRKRKLSLTTVLTMHLPMHFW